MISAIASLCLLASGVAVTHPGHASYAEVDHKADRKELQIALTLVGYDLEEALSRRAGKRINLDDTEGVHGMVEDYLGERFVVTLPDGSTPKPRFFGHEDEGKAVWLYFTVSLVGKDAEAPKAAKASPLVGVQLQNRVLMDLNAEQKNTVELRDGRWRRVLDFTEKNAKRVLREPEKRPVQKPAETPEPKRPNVESSR